MSFEWRDKGTCESFGWLNVAGKRSKVTVFVAELEEGRWQATVAGIFSSEEIIEGEWPSMGAAKFAAEMAVIDLFRKFGDEMVREENCRLKRLVKHVWIHSGYPKAGFVQMDTPMKCLFERITGERLAERD